MARIAPSLLSADFADLGRDIRRMEEAGAEILHIDVMDGHFVPNLTIGLPVVEAIRRRTKLVLDVHLMISNPDEMAERFVEAGADWVTVHFETARHLNRLLTGLRAKGARAGVVLNPHSPVSLLEDILDLCDLVLVMSVNPGYEGQEFISNSLEKVRKLKSLIVARQLSAAIEIDGGISVSNVREVVESGVDILVSGSAVFRADDPVAEFRQMQQIAGQVAIEVSK